MTEESPVFLVDPQSDPVVVKIVGRASFQNVVPLREFFQEACADGKRDFVVEFSQCVGMDSTTLGVLAGFALDLRRKQPRGSLVLTGLGQRNLELVRNLGLHRIATVDAVGETVTDSDEQTTALSPQQQSEVDKARLSLEAHESLVEADAGNQAKFQDVIAYLKLRVEEDETS